MNRLAEFQSRVADQGKSILNYTADLVEWSARKNLAVASDFAGFTVEQLRLPVRAHDFADYRLGVKGAYSEFGEVLKRHGDDYVAKIKEVPAEVRDVLRPVKKAAKAATKTAAAKPAAKKASAARKATAKKAPARKVTARTVPAPIVKTGGPDAA